MARTWCHCFSLLGLLCSLSAAAASPVWAVHGPHGTVYLAGSVHLLEAGQGALPPGFDRAWRATHLLVLEMDPGELDPMAAAAWMAEHGTLAPGRSLEQVTGPARYARLAAQAQRVGLPEALLEGLAPWMVGLQLIELRYAQLGFEAGSGVEAQLAQRASAEHHPTLGLETLEQQLSLFAKLPEDEQLRFLDMVLDGLPQVQSETRTVVEAWRTGDAPQLARLLGEEYRAFPSLYRRLVSDRNRRWLPRIEQLLGQSSDALVVVGALHLVGSDGLLELLRRDGYAAEELP